MLGDLVICYEQNTTYSLFWCINHLFLSNTMTQNDCMHAFFFAFLNAFFTSAQWLLVYGNFHRQCTADHPVTIGVQNSVVVVKSYWSKNSKLLWVRGRSCHRESFHPGDSPRQEYDNDDMPNITKALMSRDIKTWQGSVWQDQMHGSLHERPIKHYILSSSQP